MQHLLPASFWFIACLILRHWRWSWHFLPKHLLIFNALHSVITLDNEVIFVDVALIAFISLFLHRSHLNCQLSISERTAFSLAVCIFNILLVRLWLPGGGTHIHAFFISLVLLTNKRCAFPRHYPLWRWTFNSQYLTRRLWSCWYTSRSLISSKLKLQNASVLSLCPTLSAQYSLWPRNALTLSLFPVSRL
jgi:hypothetical protein